MGAHVRSERRRAASRKWCPSCGREIAAGEPYRRIVVQKGGEKRIFTTHEACPEPQQVGQMTGKDG